MVWMEDRMACCVCSGLECACQFVFVPSLRGCVCLLFVFVRHTVESSESHGFPNSLLHARPYDSGLQRFTIHQVRGYLSECWYTMFTMGIMIYLEMRDGSSLYISYMIVQ